MELNQLKQFKTVAECANMTQAAKQLFITQPALSRSIKMLEEEIGAQVFDRVGKKLILNDVGKACLKMTNQIFSIVENMTTFMTNNDEHPRITVVTSLLAFSSFILPRYLVDFPDSNLTCFYYTQDEIDDIYINKLSNKQYDIIISDKMYGGSYINIPICQDFSGISIKPNHKLANKKSISLDDLQCETFATFQSTNPLTQMTKTKLSSMKGINYLIQPNFESTKYILEHTNVCSIFSSISQYCTTSNERIFIPFKKNENLFLNYFISYDKYSGKAMEISKLIKWLKDYLADYNNEMLDFDRVQNKKR